MTITTCHQISNTRRTVVGNKLYLHSQLNTWLQWIGQRQLQDETKILKVLGFGASYIRYFTVVSLLKIVQYVIISQLCPNDMTNYLVEAAFYLLSSILKTGEVLVYVRAYAISTYIAFQRVTLDSLWHSDTLRWHKPESTLACCLTPSYLNQCRHTNSDVMWHSCKMFN